MKGDDGSVLDMNGIIRDVLKEDSHVWVLIRGRPSPPTPTHFLYTALAHPLLPRVSLCGPDDEVALPDM
jgi:hypothetical protein